MSEPLLRRAPQVLWRSVGAEVVVAVPSRTDFELLSGSGGAIWRALDEPRTLSRLVDALAEEHGVEGGAIVDDVRHLTSTLAARGLLEQAEVEETPDG